MQFGLLGAATAITFSVIGLNCATGYPVAQSLGLADLEKESDRLCRKP